MAREPQVRKLKSGAPAHNFTAEERRRGGLRSGAVKREMAKSVRQRFADRLEADADELYQAFRKAWVDGDWKAAQGAMHEAFGKPTDRVELTGADGGPVETVDRSASLADVARLLRDTGAIPGDGG